MGSCWLELRQRHAGLPLVLAGLVGVAGLADVVGIGLEEEHLADAFVGVDLGRAAAWCCEISSVTWPSHSGSNGVTLVMMPQRA